MPNIPVLINGRAYDWDSLTTLIAGVPVSGIVKIDYDESQVKEDNYGAGTKPVARGYGRKTSTASITLFAEEVEAICASAPNGNLINISPFEIIVSYRVGTIITTHILKNVEFTKNHRTANEGDTSLKVDLPLIVSHILWKKP